MNQIEQNDKRMKWMAENIGEKYYAQFGLFCMSGGEIQDAIDYCWEIFKPEDE